MSSPKEMLEDFEKTPMVLFSRKYGHLTFQGLYELLEFQEARIRELEADLTKYAVLKANKDFMPPGASLVFCYETNGVPVLADDLYPDFVVVRRDDLSTLWEFIPDCYRWPKGGPVVNKIVWLDRLKAALEETT